MTFLMMGLLAGLAAIYARAQGPRSDTPLL
jgi:hypothetical protein